MPGKKPKKPAPSVRYLLSGDRKLQRLSLRKMAGGAKKSKAQPRVRARTLAAAAPSPAGFAWVTDSRAFLLGGICVVAAAALITAGPPSQTLDMSGAVPFETGKQPNTVPVAAQPEPATVAESRPPVASAPPEPARSMAPPPTRAAVEPVRPVAAARARPDLEPVAAPVASPATRTPEATPIPAPDSTPPAESGGDVTPITITGCLAFDDQVFWLQDTSGADAPKARSWRSGFLKKRASPVALVDASGAVGLPTHVGHRVAATGTLANREMRVRSLQRIAASCS